MRNLFKIIAPPAYWRLPVMIVIGVLIGIGLAAFKISNAVSYMSNDPRACVNCHIMAAQYASWSHSAHRLNATCNDCHVPQDNIIRGLLFKARDGMRHSAIFALRQEPQVIRMHEAGQTVVQENCLRCHLHLFSRLEDYHAGYSKTGNARHCWECHRFTPHGREKSLSSVEYARIPALDPVIPDWIRKALDGSDNGAPNEQGR